MTLQLQPIINKAKSGELNLKELWISKSNGMQKEIVK
jgi:hypothetical protein